MALVQRTDPLRSFRFRVEKDSIIMAGFSEVSGLQVEVETEDYNEGGVNSSVHRLPKSARHSNLTLRRGVVVNKTDLWDWQQKVVNGIVEPNCVAVVLLDDLGEEQWRWCCRDAYPVRWTGPDLRASESNVAIESLELAHKGFL